MKIYKMQNKDIHKMI